MLYMLTASAIALLAMRGLFAVASDTARLAQRALAAFQRMPGRLARFRRDYATARTRHDLKPRYAFRYAARLYAARRARYAYLAATVPLYTRDMLAAFPAGLPHGSAVILRDGSVHPIGRGYRGTRDTYDRPGAAPSLH